MVVASQNISDCIVVQWRPFRNGRGMTLQKWQSQATLEIGKKSQKSRSILNHLISACMLYSVEESEVEASVILAR